MKKTTLLIDAGYLQRIMMKTHFHCNTDAMVKIANSCHSSAEELQKILYYDCDSFDPIDAKTNQIYRYLRKNPNGSKLVKKENKLIKSLAQQDLFAIRLGVLKFNGWVNNKPTFRQKGVDMRIGLDMAHLAHQGKIDRIILITADTDFIPAMKYVRKAAIQVVLMKLNNNRLVPALTMHADFIRPLDLQTLNLSRHQTT